ncbi:hypothetical protein ACM01_16820 [Streptomyces viridochromogenes]|uniref:Uncharacterized protein n=1 Tax=Streptomyces viridochromogenes TaxID=1938 RepID=A0A0J8C737_STRVR|nr:hypothetical protein [Streptomyces viridochromogenes]KMS73705.1 hypothetical protein ACM01_16820 [Streptomyces viridochromogenes]KOG22466.1 hypothetical protein ADK36_11650 [Streptomyces viridochromogenes]KOG27554.1 hypothetical protein ADK35_05805 [Streptomyces viridochromogenes]
MSRGDVSEVPRVTELLGRALQGVPMPSGPGADAVFARAARVRWRRRRAVTGTAAAVALVGLVGTGTLPWNGPERSGAARSAPASGAERLARLLPPGIGEIREVGNVVGEGPYDGLYAVHKDGGVGYLNVQVLPSRREDWPVAADEGCSSDVPGTSAACVSETLPNGDERESTESTRESRGDGTTSRPWRSVRLFTKGYAVMIRAGSGFAGRWGLGPGLDAPPLTAEQLRDVVTAPELLP